MYYDIPLLTRLSLFYKDSLLELNFKIKYYSNIKSRSSLYIFQGMQYVHTSVFRSHGRLKSSNCVIDNRWLCKVTDFGLTQLKKEDTPKSKTSDEFQKYNGKFPIC